MQEGLANLDIIVFVLAGVIILLIILVVRLELRLKKLLSGKSGNDLESSINYIRDGLDKQTIINAELIKRADGLDSRLRRSIRGLATVRFNPYKGTGSGGNQSFATAFLDEEGTGVVISSLYGRDHFSAFAKPIINHKPEFILSKEEKEAFKKALEQLQNK